MRRRNVGQLFCTFVIVAASALSAISCGGAGDNASIFPSMDAADRTQPPPPFDGSLLGDAPTGPMCTPKTCAQLGFTCGKNGDGCGGVLNCDLPDGGSPCPPGQFCGGGGYSHCGSQGNPNPDAGTCAAATCASLGFTCGAAGDGCGGALNCDTANADGGTGCPFPTFCGGGGFNKCGGDKTKTPDGASPCAATTCTALGYGCGPASDGCGVQLQCGTCPAGQTCGGGGTPFQCGSSVPVLPDGGPIACVPKTCQTLGFNCGAAGDGCGNLIASCGTCTAPAFCGGGGFDTCGTTPTVPIPDSSIPCVPTTCQALGYNCGPASDLCGGLLQCGTCQPGQTCGAGGPNVCASSIPCVGLCQQQVACDAGAQTTITGKVLAGASAWTNLTPDPVPNVLVFVANGTVQNFAAGAACRQCGADVSGLPLVSTYTNFDGTFTLTNVPAGTPFTLVAQLGRWRRKFPIPAVTACASTAVGNLNLPRNKGEGDIPFTAISTGNVDPLECVLLKMGIDQAEFTPDNGNGRIHIYGGGPLNGGGGSQFGPGSTAGAGTRREASLMGAGGTYANYDQIMLPCWGNPVDKTANWANLINYADSGGHFFATHYSYAWLVNNGEFNNVAQWVPDYNNPGAVTWTLNVSQVVPPSPPAPYAGTFVKWLNLITALSNSGPTVPANPHVRITNARHDANAVANGSVDWIDGTDPDHNNGLVEHFTFNTPVGAASQCGHAIFSDFHVAGIQNGPNTNGQTFPSECTKTFTAQEKILEFMVWDLASCVNPPPTTTCTPRTCATQNLHCGPAGDGCGLQIDCGTCPAGQSCIGGTCRPPDGGLCAPTSCVQQGIQCGAAGDGCGNALNCGTCTAPQTCGGCGVPGQCCSPDASSCSPLTCAQQNIACGPAGDGCGRAIDCGPCPPPDGGTSCSPSTCFAQNIGCGPAGDGCGNLLDCGPCPTGLTCGCGGVSGQCCGGGTCVPQTCASLHLNCGPAGDGCGGLLDCGACSNGMVCGIILPGVCGGGTM
jgi:hypothetical protein